MLAAVCGLVQQTNEKIDRTRALACEVLMSVIFHAPALPHIPFHSDLQQLFKEYVHPLPSLYASPLPLPLIVCPSPPLPPPPTCDPM